MFLFIHKFFEDYLIFFGEGVLSVSHSVDNYTKNVDERGRKFICERTLPRMLVLYYTLVTSKAQGFENVKIGWLNLQEYYAKCATYKAARFECLR